MLETINGRAVSWSEIKITANVQGGFSMPQIDVKAINYETKIDIGEQRGASGGRVMKRTTGAASNSGSATFYRDGLRDLKKVIAPVALAAGFVNSEGHAQLSLVKFDLVVVHDWADDPEIHQMDLIACQLFKDGGKFEEGTDAETVDVDLNPLRIIETVAGIKTVLL